MEDPSEQKKLARKWQPTNYDTVVIYHGGCADGSAAAAVFIILNKNVERTYFHCAQDRDIAKDKFFPKLNDKIVYIVDYSYSPDVIKQFCSVATKVILYDHHETAMDLIDLKLPNFKCVFDMKKCGAEITWTQLTDQPVPWWIDHVRDRDLWEWKSPKSHAFSSSYYKMGLSIDSILKIVAMNSQELDNFYKEGQLLYNFEVGLIDRMSRNASWATFDGHKVLALNSIIYGSECGDLLLKNQYAKMSVLYRYNMQNGVWDVSLRSRKLASGAPEINVGMVAKKYGGGGHPCAAGFSWDGDIKTIIKYDPTCSIRPVKRD